MRSERFSASSRPATAGRGTPLRALALTCLVSCAVLLCMLLPAGEAAAATHKADVKRAMTQLSGRSGAYAYNITKKRAIAGHNQGTARIIASNTKLFTGAAVLLRYGTGGRFTTSLWSTAEPKNGVLRGSLFLRGGGDPLFGSSSYVKRNFGSKATITALAKELRKAGVKRVTGRVWGDQTAFDTRRGTTYSGWRPNGDIGGLLGGLIVDKGWAGGRYQSNPATYAAGRMSAELRRLGVKVSGKTGTKATPKRATRLAYVRSLPMSALVRQMNKPSNNYLAEMLVKTLALPVTAAEDDADGGLVAPQTRKATTRSGYLRAAAQAAKFGSKVRLADGSGLSRGNRAAPREIVDLLRGMRETVAYSDFKASMPIAGVDGTLAGRMRHSAAKRVCSGKTGTLSNVSSLAGYCKTKSGDLIAYAIVNNTVSPPSARAQQDRIVGLLAGMP